MDTRNELFPVIGADDKRLYPMRDFAQIVPNDDGTFRAVNMVGVEIVAASWDAAWGHATALVGEAL